METMSKLRTVLDVLTDVCAVIRKHSPKTLHYTVQSLWELSVKSSSIGSLVLDHGHHMTILATLSVEVEADLLLIYSRVFSLSGTDAIESAIKEISASVVIYYPEKDKTETVQKLISIYTEAPHLMAIALFELLSLEQLNTIGLKPYKVTGTAE